MSVCNALGLKLAQLLVVGECVLELVALLVALGAPEQRLDKGRVELDGSRALGNALGRLGHLEVTRRTIREEDRALFGERERAGAQGARVVLERLGELVLLEEVVADSLELL